MNILNGEYRNHIQKVKKATEILDTVCDIVFDEKKEWDRSCNKRKAVVYARMKGLINEDEYNLIMESGIL